MAEFKISRIRYTWRGNWAEGINYQKDDVVRLSGSSYVCIRLHTSSSNFFTDQSYLANPSDSAPSPAWTKMTDGLYFQGSWQSSTVYDVGDVVRQGGYLWVCVEGHQSSAAFSLDVSKWDNYVISVSWKGNWVGGAVYGVGDIVRWGGTTYKSNTAHTATNTSTGLANQSAYWDIYSQNVESVGVWAENTLYKTFDLVLYQGTVFRCTTAHTSTSTFDAGNFTLEFLGSGAEGEWSAANYYGEGSVVKYGGVLYRANFSHAGSDTAHSPFNSIYQGSGSPAWSVLSKGINFVGTWSSTGTYKTGDVVRRGGNLYVALLDSTNDGSTLDYLDDSNWELIQEGQSWRGTWSTDVTYSINDVVVYKGSTYKANQEHSSSFENFPGDNGSGFNYWDLLIKGNDLIGMTGPGQLLSYGLSRSIVGDGSTLGALGVNLGRPGEVLSIDSEGSLYYREYQKIKRTFYVSVNGSDNYDLPVSSYTTYVVNTTQTLIAAGTGGSPSTYSADDGNFYVDGEAKPALTFEQGSVYTFTQSGASMDNHPLLFSSNDPNGSLQNGSIYSDGVVYRLDNTVVNQTEYLTNFNTAVSRSIEITISSNTPNTLYYYSYLDLNMGGVITVEANATNTGGTILNPFRTVRYAAERADDGFAGQTTIFVQPGIYEEVLPIIVPARTVVLGSELRSTTIKAKPAIAALANDDEYTKLTLLRIKSLMANVLTGQSITKTGTNPENPVVVRDYTGNPVVTNPDTVTDVEDLIDGIIQKIDFEINSTGTDVTVTGTNAKITAENIQNTITVLAQNRTFFEYEAAAYVAVNYPSYVFDADNCRRDMRKYIDSLIYDITYPGNYKSQLAARYYINSVLGSQSEDMFYMRDATGLRDCTLKGLTGTLNPPNVFDLYRRPTGSSYVSLDPGWGPNDTRTWINTRSPYIQGVTNIGSGCFGQTIDGALHNGGYKSMVSNDFTQVLSDGIGAYVTNNGRAELVSVFTYYCQVGYLAENGGKIRAANGNCSYGNFGAIADGIDATEVPATATVNGRDQDSQVANVFIGNLETGIKAFEYSNAGNHYTSATATIVGSGSGASTEFVDFRDNAIMEARLLDASDSTVQVGGGGFTFTNNNAQVNPGPGNDLTGIFLYSTDTGTEAQYLGKRIFIRSGTGAGQYGYITAYDEITKRASVSRDSDDQPGWDHVIPGTVPVTVFDNSTAYRIEPRLYFSDPGFESYARTLPNSTSWNSVAYSETTTSYGNVQCTPGTGTVVEDDGLIAFNARFNVAKVGRSYSSVTLNAGGAGYAVGDEVTISGDDLGGQSPDNDITITVTETSDDSTNSIISFTYEGEPSSGVFVAVSSSLGNGVYSVDGSTWTTFSMPSVGTWNVSGGNNGFVMVKRGTDIAAYSKTGISWSTSTLPAAANWERVVYGSGVWLAIASNTNDAAYSTNDGATWTAVTLPSLGDSTLNTWVDLAYGKNKFVILANSNNMTASGTYSGGSWTWSGSIMDVIDDSSQKDWTSIAYGNNRWVAVSSTGDVAYSFDAINWYGSSMPTQDGSTAHYWKKITYGQGTFLAMGDTGSRNVFGDVTTGPSTFCARSESGLVWSGQTLTSSLSWSSVAFGNPHLQAEDSTIQGRTGMFIAVASGNTVNEIRTGCRAKGYATFSSGRVVQVRLWDPGSGYRDIPTATIVDSSNTSDPEFDLRVSEGVLAQPEFISRGSSYGLNTTVSISGNGYADIYAVGKFVKVSGLGSYPGPGARIIFNGDEENSYTLVSITELGENYNGTTGFSATFRVSPELKVRKSINHGTAVTVRERYSQVRITGHDFLDVGTGNFVDTNYPNLYSASSYVWQPEDEVLEEGGGKVFYTSTDQSGNFRTGELFAVEQATGIVTISADFFDLTGLTELRLGGIRVGGSGVIIREFSTDPLFLEDSNNIVPTQRAIAAYLANRLSIGGNDLAAQSFIAGNVSVGPSNITNILGLGINLPKVMKVEGSKAAITGSIMAQSIFHRSFDQGF